MSEQAEEVEETKPEPKYDPGPEFKEKVKEVLDELGLLSANRTDESANRTDERPKSKTRTLREEEADSEFLVSKVLDKMKKDAPPAPAKAEKVEVEEPPGPPPKKRKIQSAMWG